MHKKIISFLLVVVLFICLSIPVYASLMDKPVQPSLSFSGNRAYCSAYVSSSGQSIILTLKLYHNGTIVGMWTDSGTSYVSVSGDTPVGSGYSYTLEVSGWINGVAIDGGSVTATCP